MKIFKRTIIYLIYRIYKKFFYSKIIYNLKLQDVIQNEFHKLYYYNDKRTWRNTFWLNIPTFKVPFDLWIYQEIIVEVKPDVIIECGTASGGSALFFATICDAINFGGILSIDIEKIANRPKHKRISYLNGSSISKKVINAVKKKTKNVKKIMVILDSNHKKEHVYEELKNYAKLVTIGSYLIVEDTHLYGHPVRQDFYEGGPMEALEEFLLENRNFVVDLSKEKFYFTFYPHGFLKRIS